MKYCVVEKDREEKIGFVHICSSKKKAISIMKKEIRDLGTLYYDIFIAEIEE